MREFPSRARKNRTRSVCASTRSTLRLFHTYAQRPQREIPHLRKCPYKEGVGTAQNQMPLHVVGEKAANVVVSYNTFTCTMDRCVVCGKEVLPLSRRTINPPSACCNGVREFFVPFVKPSLCFQGRAIESRSSFARNRVLPSWSRHESGSSDEVIPLLSFLCRA